MCISVPAGEHILTRQPYMDVTRHFKGKIWLRQKPGTTPGTSKANDFVKRDNSFWQEIQRQHLWRNVNIN